MEPLINRKVVIAVLTIACLTAVLLVAAPTRSSTGGPAVYNTWLDVNNDDRIDMKDIGAVSKQLFTQGAPGENVSKASLAYDSGWLDLRNKVGEYYTITHNLNDTDLQVDAREITPGWNQTYGGTNDDGASALVQTTDGGYALAGYTNSFGAGGDFWLVKTDASGAMQWNKTYGGTGNDNAYALVQTTDGGYALAGRTGSFVIGAFDFWLVKTDASGTMQWNKTYGGTGNEGANALVQTGDGGYALAGSTDSFGAGNGDFWLVKTDASGTMQWNKTYGGTGWDWANAFVQTTDGGYALAGHTFSFGAGQDDFWLVKTDASGTMQWNKTYGGTSSDVANALVQTGDGGYALAGYTNSFAAGVLDFWLVKTDASGTMQWNKTYGGATSEEVAHALVQTRDGGYALAGETSSLEFPSGIWLVKADGSGTMQWNKTYEGTETAYALVQTGDGGYALAGYTGALSSASNWDFWLVKTDVESGLAWAFSSANTITVYGGATDSNWNYVRVRLWKPR